MGDRRKTLDIESRLAFSIVLNMLIVVSSAMVSFTHVDARQNRDVPKHPQNERFSLNTL